MASRTPSASDPSQAPEIAIPGRPLAASLESSEPTSRLARKGSSLTRHMTRIRQAADVDGLAMPYRVLLVEDEIGIRVGLEASLRFAGCEVAIAEDGEVAMRRAAHGGFDVIVLDLMLPLKGGLEVCEELRASGVSTPIVMLTARTQVQDRLRGFAAGADDYLAKPFDVMELLARIKAVVRRTKSPTQAPVQQVHEFGDVRVDVANATVWRGNERIRLSMMEYALLQYLVKHPSEVVDRRHILDKVWGSDSSIGPRTVDVHITWLRKKIGDDPGKPRWIRTVHGKGYSFTPE